MPVVEKRSGRSYIQAIDQLVTTGDQVAVPEGLAAHLVDRGDFVLVEDEADETDNSADDGDDEFDVDSWLEQPYDDCVDRVLAGEVDDHLETIADAESRTTVTDAIGERRAELEE